MGALNTGPLPNLLRSGQNRVSAARQCICGLLHALGGGAELLDKVGCTPEVLLPLAEGAAVLLLGSGHRALAPAIGGSSPPTPSAQSSLQLRVASIYLQRLMHPDIGLGHEATRLFAPQPTADWLSAVADALLAPQIACSGKHTHTLPWVEARAAVCCQLYAVCSVKCDCRLLDSATITPAMQCRLAQASAGTLL